MAGDRTEDTSLTDLKSFGAPASVLEKVEAEVSEAQKPFEVWPENWPAVEMFLRLRTQWIMGMGGPVGLNYASIEAVFRIFKPKRARALFDDLRQIEMGALEAFSRGKDDK